MEVPEVHHKDDISTPFCYSLVIFGGKTKVGLRMEALDRFYIALCILIFLMF